jgi:hypothetical protein
MQPENIAINVLQIVVLALPAVAAYYKLVIQMGIEDEEDDLTKVEHLSRQSVFLFLTVSFITIPGIISTFILYQSTDVYLLKLAMGFITGGLLSVIKLNYDWYISNTNDLKEELENMESFAEQRVEDLDYMREIIYEIPFNDIEYIEKIKLKKKLTEEFDKFIRFEYSADDSLESIVNEYLYDYYPKRRLELQKSIDDTDQLKEDVFVLPTSNSVKKFIFSPKKLLILLIDFIAVILFISTSVELVRILLIENEFSSRHIRAVFILFLISGVVLYITNEIRKSPTEVNGPLTAEK